MPPGILESQGPWRPQLLSCIIIIIIIISTITITMTTTIIITITSITISIDIYQITITTTMRLLLFYLFAVLSLTFMSNYGAWAQEKPKNMVPVTKEMKAYLKPGKACLTILVGAPTFQGKSIHL